MPKGYERAADNRFFIFSVYYSFVVVFFVFFFIFGPRLVLYYFRTRNRIPRQCAGNNIISVDSVFYFFISSRTRLSYDGNRPKDSSQILRSSFNSLCFVTLTRGVMVWRRVCNLTITQPMLENRVESVTVG